MERRLLEAAQKGNIDELNVLIGSNGLILEELALQGAGHTPLHIACVAGHLDFVQELLKLMPKFAEKVNVMGYSPLHIAAARGDIEIARELLRVGRRLCFVKGRERRIPLHYAIINGELDVMKVLLSASPESVEETTAQEETALHLAVKNNRFGAVIVLVEHLKQHKKEQVINWKDNKGNTVLQHAAAVNNFEVVDFMLRGHALEDEVVEVNASKESGSTSLDVSTLSQSGAGDREITEILARAGAKHEIERSNSPGSRRVSVDDNDLEGANGHQPDGEPVTNSPQSMSRSPSNKEKESLGGGDIRNALLIIAALIASATYQAVLQPPKFTPKVNNDSKNPQFFDDVQYIFFMSGNTFGLFASVQMIICLTRGFTFKLPLILSLIAMVQTYLWFMTYVPFTSMDKPLSPTNAALLAMLPLLISFLLLIMQRRLERFWESFFEKLFKSCNLGGMNSPRT